MSVPKVQMLYGTAWKAERTAKLVQQALEAGFRGIDTAAQPRHYQGKPYIQYIDWLQNGICRKDKNKKEHLVDGSLNQQQHQHS